MWSNYRLFESTVLGSANNSNVATCHYKTIKRECPTFQTIQNFRALPKMPKRSAVKTVQSIRNIQECSPLSRIFGPYIFGANEYYFPIGPKSPIKPDQKRRSTLFSNVPKIYFNEL